MSPNTSLPRSHASLACFFLPIAHSACPVLRKERRGSQLNKYNRTIDQKNPTHYNTFQQISELAVGPGLENSCTVFYTSSQELQLVVSERSIAKDECQNISETYEIIIESFSFLRKKSTERRNNKRRMLHNIPE